MKRGGRTGDVSMDGSTFVRARASRTARRLASIASVGAVLLASAIVGVAPVRAQAPSRAAPHRSEEDAPFTVGPAGAGQASVSLSTHGGSLTDGSSVFALSAMAHGELVVGGPLVARFRFGIAAVHVSQGSAGATTVRAANPEVVAFFRGGEPRLRFRIGLGVALPLGSVPDSVPTATLDPNAVANQAYAQASAMEGGGAPWLWSVDRLTLVLPVQARIAVAPRVSVETEVAFGQMFWVGPGHHTSEGALSVAISPIVCLTGRTIAGVRGQLAFMPGGPGDGTQTSIEPFVRATFDPWFFRVGALVNLDPVSAFDRGGVWALRLMAGAHL